MLILTKKIGKYVFWNIYRYYDALYSLHHIVPHYISPIHCRGLKKKRSVGEDFRSTGEHVKPQTPPSSNATPPSKNNSSLLAQILYPIKFPILVRIFSPLNSNPPLPANRFPQMPPPCTNPLLPIPLSTQIPLNHHS